MRPVAGATSHLIREIDLISAGLFRSATRAWGWLLKNIFSKSEK
jgi:hypothetical protein